MIQILTKLLGPRGIKWAFAGTFSGIIIAALEILIASALQQILVLIGASTGVSRLSQLIPLLSGPQILFFVFILNFIKSAVSFLYQQVGVFCNEIVAIRGRDAIVNYIFNSTNQIPGLSWVVSQINDTIPRTLQFTTLLFLTLPNIISVVLTAVFLISFSPLNSIMGILGISLVGLLVVHLNKRVRNIAQHLPSHQEVFTAHLILSIKNWILLSILKTTEAEENRAQNQSLGLSQRFVRASGIAHLAGVLPMALGTGVLMSLIYFQLQYKEVSSSEFIGFLYLFSRLVQSLSSIASNLGHMNINIPYVKKTAKSLEMPKLNSGPPELNLTFFGAEVYSSINDNLQNQNTYVLTKIEKTIKPPEIHIQNLQFKYPNSTKQIFNKLDLKILPGKQLGVIGPSGVGKSTLLGLISGILEATSGSILFNNGLPKAYFDEADGRIGYVGAEPFLIGGSIRENMCYGTKVPLEDSKMISALKSAGLDSLLNANPLDFLKYTISEQGTGLSTGQKQRICLARALAVDPVLLILDEATANLDFESESAVLDSLLKLDCLCTVIIVTHRPTMLRDCSTVIELKS